MAKGDQLYVMRELVGLSGLYEHHGIDCGDGSVIHYRKVGEAAITQTSLPEFSRGQLVRIREYVTSYIPDVVVSRAHRRLGERQYNLLFNNCEHFATWCKTGIAASAQITNLAPAWLQDDRLPAVVEDALHTGSPEQAQTLLTEALSYLNQAQGHISPTYDQATQDMRTWHRVAQLAVQRDRDDLARAALQKWYAAKQVRDRLQPQLQHLQTLRQQFQSRQ